MARTPFRFPPPPGADPTQVSAAESVLCMLRVGAAGGAVALTRVQIWNYLLIAHPVTFGRSRFDLSMDRHTARLRSKAAKGIRELVETGELAILKMRVAYRPSGFRWVFWTGKNEAVPDCYSEIWQAWDEARAWETEHEIITLAEHAPAVKRLVELGGPRRSPRS